MTLPVGGLGGVEIGGILKARIHLEDPAQLAFTGGLVNPLRPGVAGTL